MCHQPNGIVKMARNGAEGEDVGEKDDDDDDDDEQ